MAQGAAYFTPSGWAQVRAASEAGLDDKTICEDFKVPRGTLTKRRSLDKKMGKPWLTPAEAKRSAEELKMRNKLNGISSHTKDAPMTAMQSVTQKLLADGELATGHGMAVLLGLLAEAAAAPESIKPLGDVGDVSVAVRAARSISGLDKPDVAMQINLGGMFPSVG